MADRVITIRSPRAQRTVSLGSGTIAAAALAGSAVLIWTAVATGLVLYNLSGLEDLDKSANSSRAAAAESIGQELVQLTRTTDSLRSQADAALEIYFDAAQAKSSTDAADAENGLSQFAAAHGSSDSEVQMQMLLATLDRSMSELEKVRQMHAAERNELAALRHQVEVKKEIWNRTLNRFAKSLELASEGIEGIFRQLNLSPEDMSKEAQRLYSGIGGVDLGFHFHAHLNESALSEYEKQQIQGFTDSLDQINLYRLAYLSLPIGHPVRGRNRFTSGFGPRNHPVTGRRHLHQGADFAAPTGTDVVATGDGTVVFTGTSGGYGKTVRIRHIAGFESQYSHLSRILVEKGQRVARGDHIGDIGSTGQSTGPHLHYEVVVRNRPVDPLKYIRARNNVH